MPPSLTIGAFVLGGVLLLISILRGGFKLFGAEVSSHAGSGARLVAFVIGIVLLVTAFITNSPAPDVAKPTDDAGSPPSQQPIHQPDNSSPGNLQNEPEQESRPAPSQKAAPREDEERGKAAVLVEWRAADEELKQAFSGLTNEQRVALGFAAIMAQRDLYGIIVRITNTGNVPIQIAPNYVQLTYQGNNVPLTTAEDARFLRVTDLQPNEYAQGLLMYEAALVGGSVVAAGGRLSYNDPRVSVSFGR